MLQVSLSEAKRDFGALIGRVSRGEAILITKRGKPVALIEPPRSTDIDWEARLARLEKAGIVRRGTGKPADDILSREPPRAKEGASIVQVLLEEREEGR